MNCKNCIHWNKCSKTNGKTRYYGETIASDNVEELCEWFISTADVVPKSEVEKIFEEIEKTIRAALILIDFSYKHNQKEMQCKKECYEDFLGYIAELKKKYTEGEQRND